MFRYEGDRLIELTVGEVLAAKERDKTVPATKTGIDAPLRKAQKSLTEKAREVFHR